MDIKQWEKQNMPKAEDELIELTREIYNSAQKTSEDSIDITGRGEAFIKSLHR